MTKPDFEVLAKELCSMVRCDDTGCEHSDDEVMAALRAAYAAGLERAAEIAFDWRDYCGYSSSATLAVGRAIRAEKENAP